jgi:hypothetical protein
LYLAQWEVATQTGQSCHRKVNKFTNDEIFKFIGIAVMHGIRPTSRLHLYWSGDPVISNDLISNAMPLNRFEDLVRFLHLADNDKDDKKEKLFKIREFYSKFNERCENA